MLISNLNEYIDSIEFIKKNNDLKSNEKLNLSASKKRKDLEKISNVVNNKEEIFLSTDKLESKENNFKKLNSIVLTEKQILFFTNHQPKQCFYFYRDQKNKIKIDVPLELKNPNRIIYIIKNNITNCDLIGETDKGLKGRCSSYLSELNREGSGSKTKKIGKKTFLKEIKQNPSFFSIGILYELKPEEDLEILKDLFVKYRREHYQLYNDNESKNERVSHQDEEITTYAIPKPETGLLTPIKYYPYQKDEEGNIRLPLTPGFRQAVETLRQNMEDTQLFVYVIKNLVTEQRYIGITGDPESRGKRHGYEAEYCDPNHIKYNEEQIGGLIHPAMALQPEDFAYGLFPIISANQLPKESISDYFLVERIGYVEKRVIALLETEAVKDTTGSHKILKGYNDNKGGGGCLPRSARRKLEL